MRKNDTPILDLVKMIKTERDQEAILELMNRDFTRRSFNRYFVKYPFAYDERESISNYARFMAVTQACDKYDEDCGSFEGLIDSIIRNVLYDMAQSGATIYLVRIPRHMRPRMTAFGRALLELYNVTNSNGDIDYNGQRREAINAIAKKMSDTGFAVNTDDVEELERCYRLSMHRESMYAADEGCTVTAAVENASVSQTTYGNSNHDMELGIAISSAVSTMDSDERAVFELKWVRGYKNSHIVSYLKKMHPEEAIDGNTVRRCIYSIKVKMRHIRNLLD